MPGIDGKQAHRWGECELSYRQNIELIRHALQSRADQVLHPIATSRCGCRRTHRLCRPSRCHRSRRRDAWRHRGDLCWHWHASATTSHQGQYPFAYRFNRPRSFRHFVRREGSTAGQHKLPCLVHRLSRWVSRLWTQPAVSMAITCSQQTLFSQNAAPSRSLFTRQVGRSVANAAQ